MFFRDAVLWSVVFVVALLFVISFALLVAFILRLRTYLQQRLLEEQQQLEFIQLTHSAEVQELWRREQLCRVATILTSYNVAFEAFPLATQLPGCREMLTDPKPQNVPRSQLRFLLQADGTVADVATVVAAARAKGPLPDALPATDLLQIFIVWMSRHHRTLDRRFMRDAFDFAVDARRCTVGALPTATDVYGPGAAYTRREWRERVVPFAAVSGRSENITATNKISSAAATRGTKSAVAKGKYIYSEYTAVTLIRGDEAGVVSIVEDPLTPSQDALF